jgi:arginyl-tRNA synthetase
VSTIAESLTALVETAARASGALPDGVALEACVPTANASHGDYQSNHAMRVAKALKQNPRQVAENLKAALLADPAAQAMVADVSVAGPGFLNFKLRDDFLARDVEARSADLRLGAPAPGAGKKLVIDYSSPNVAKRMHVGHLRSTVIGDALARLFRFVGYEVVADNHIGDWGTQFGMLFVGWDRWRDEAAYEADAIGELQRLYQKFRAEAESDATLHDAARQETALLQQGEPVRTALWKRFVAASLVEFDGVYDRLDIRFDVTLGESFYNPVLAELVADLLAKGIAVEDDGAVIIRFGPEDGPGLGEAPMLIRKRDGAALYGTTDLATIRHRRDTWAPARVVYVTDTRQQGHFRHLFAAARKIGWDTPLEHVWFGMLKLGDGAVVSTRKGAGDLNLIDVLDAAAAHARTVVDDKSGHLPDDERARIAEAIGTGAIKYADLSQNPQSDIIFDWGKMLSLEGNTAPYLMYAVARVRSVFRNAGDDAVVGPIALGEAVERELALAVARTPEVILAAAASSRPNLLCEHLFGLTNTFGRFYHDCPILKADGDVRASRLALARATDRALTTGLGLLGIQALDRM